MMKLLLTSLLFLSFALSAAQKTITVKEVHNAITSEAGINGTIVDVRTPAEFAEGHVPGAINVPHRDIEEYLSKLAPLEKDGLILYCRSGKRAGYAIDKLKEAGMTNLTYMEGDMTAWLKADLPTEKPATQ